MSSPKNQQQVNRSYSRIRNYIYSTADLLGAGNFSKVYSGKNQITNEPIAVKVVELESLKTLRLQELLRTEIEVLTKLNHPNVLKCFEVFSNQNQCYIVTEVCNGGDLDMFVKKVGFLSQTEAAPFIKNIFEGLCYLAQINVVHRDLKVANVFINNGIAKLADFGFALFTKQKFRDLNIGSPLYMSPQGFIDCVYGPKTDVWAFGILIYQLLHGDTPYSFCKLENDLKYNLSLPFDRSKVKASVSPALKQVIFRCLEIDQSKRISINELKELSYFRKMFVEPNISVSLTVQKSQQIRHPLFSANFSNANSEGMFKHIGSLQKLNSNHQKTNKNQDIRLTQPYSNLTVGSIYSPHNLTPRPRANLIEGGHQNFIHLGRPISSQRHGDKLSIPTINRQRINSRDTKRPTQKYIILNSKINFKIAVNILHYCRSIFRCLQLMISIKQGETEIKYLTGWLILVLQQLNKKLNQGEIIFEGENGTTKSQKLRQVRNQYQRKYVNELKLYISNFINKPTLQDIKLFFFLLYRRYDISIVQQNNQQMLQLGHIVVLLYDSTRLLKKCQAESNFNRFLNYKDLQSMMNWVKQKFDINSYLSFKKRMIINN